jgi:hypothetical protein
MANRYQFADCKFDVCPWTDLLSHSSCQMVRNIGENDAVFEQ